MRDYLRLMIVLAVVSAVAGGALALVNSFTEPKIVAFKAQAEANAYQEALPDAETFSSEPKLLDEIKADPALSNIQDVKVGLKDGNEVGWVCKVAAPGYSSNIIMLVGIGVNGKMGKLLILDQKETPGLGTNVTDPAFNQQAAFTKVDPQVDLKVNKDGGSVQAITGATISSRAVVRGVNQVLKFYRNQVTQ